MRSVARAAWSVADQAFSALSNVLLTVAVARAAEQQSFGAFALSLAFVRIAMTANRALSGEPLIVRFSRVSPEERREGIGAGLGLTLLLSLGLGSLLLLVAVVVGHPLREPLMAGAVGLPLVLLQDTWRYGTLAAGEPRRVAMSDLLWLGLQCALFGFLATTSTKGSAWYILAWAACAGASLVPFVAADRKVLSVRRGVQWFRVERSMSLRFGVEYLLLQGALQSAIMLVAAVSGLEAAGALRGAETFFGPAMVLVLGMRMFGMHSGALESVHEVDRLRRTMLVVSASGAVVAGCVALGGAIVPDELGRALLGETWESTKEIIPYFALAAVASACANGAYTGLRAVAAAKESLRARTVESPLILLGAIGGAVLDGASGAAVGLALAYAVGATISWRSLMRYRSDPVVSDPTRPEIT